MEILNLVCCASPFILPSFLGIRILSRASDDFSRFAGWLTLKPLIATPLWLFLVNATFSGNWDKPTPAYILTALPGIGLTLLIILVHRSAFQSHLSSSKILLGLDTVRWGSSFLAGLFSNSLTLLFVGIALAMPTVFALLAQILCQEPSQHET